MDYQGCSRARTSKGLSHTFDTLSGWCLHGCGNRDDGRCVSYAGAILNLGPTYAPTELAYLQSKADYLNRARTPIRKAHA